MRERKRFPFWGGIGYLGGDVFIGAAIGAALGIGVGLSLLAAAIVIASESL